MRAAQQPRPRVKACRRASDRTVTPAGQHAARIPDRSASQRRCRAGSCPGRIALAVESADARCSLCRASDSLVEAAVSKVAASTGAEAEVSYDVELALEKDEQEHWSRTLVELMLRPATAAVPSRCAAREQTQQRGTWHSRLLHSWQHEHLVVVGYLAAPRGKHSPAQSVGTIEKQKLAWGLAALLAEPAP
jgi:hypothetical protein